MPTNHRGQPIQHNHSDTHRMIYEANEAEAAQHQGELNELSATGDYPFNYLVSGNLFGKSGAYVGTGDSHETVTLPSGKAVPRYMTTFAKVNGGEYGMMAQGVDNAGGGYHLGSGTYSSPHRAAYAAEALVKRDREGRNLQTGAPLSDSEGLGPEVYVQPQKSDDRPPLNNNRMTDY